MPRREAHALLVVAVFAHAAAAQAPEPKYVRGSNREASILATLKANGFPNFEGAWHAIGPFDNDDNRGFDTAYPPEREIDLAKTYPGKHGEKLRWTPLKDFKPGTMVNLARYKDNANGVVYLFHEFTSERGANLPVSFGSDDSLKVWFNGQNLVSDGAVRPAAPDQNEAVFKLKAGKNQVLVKVTQGGGEWQVWLLPGFPFHWPATVRQSLQRDFPEGRAVGIPGQASVSAEDRHYRIVTLPVPPECVLEAGGLAFRPDGKLLVCTRRGEVWLVHEPTAEDVAEVRFTRFAAGLHESLGLVVEDNNSLILAQRPELTRLIDKDGDGRADEYQTICDKWGISGDYHEYAFGPARDKDGNLFVTLNVGFSGGHQSKAPWRGWCVKITPDGKLEPWAAGFRSPNGINFSPDGDLFYTDNQGEWVASNKLHHVRRGEFYGHPAGNRWLKDSPFAGVIDEKPTSGMYYDGQKGPSGVGGMPKLVPPCIWFPYGRMGQSASEPRWDTTGGKFGPFAGQLFVGDQCKSLVMRVALELVNGRYQGACFPFRSGFQCGVNRMAFGPDGAMYVGETRRGWGSLGTKDYGLERLVFTGVVPFEMHHVSLTKTGFDVTLTKPLAPGFPGKDKKPADAVSVQSYTYNYFSNYGSPEVDRKAEEVGGVTLSADRRTLSVGVGSLRRGRVYELRLSGVKSADGDDILHPEAYYTLNELR
jgi:hypothetical protein